ncbi:MAG: PIN domain-containing protein [Lautropia sp.]
MSVDFLDSDIFVYLFDETDGRKRETAKRLVEDGIRTGRACISFQVVQETLNVLTRKLQPPLSADDARRFMTDVLTPLWRVMPSPALYQRALDLQRTYSLSFYDALIVAAAFEAGADRLLRSEDLQHGLRIERLRVENPFLA